VIACFVEAREQFSPIGFSSADDRGLGSVRLAGDGVSCANVAHQRPDAGKNLIDLPFIAQNRDGAKVNAEHRTIGALQCSPKGREWCKVAAECDSHTVSVGALADLCKCAFDGGDKIRVDGGGSFMFIGHFRRGGGGERRKND
jgi:hypothetical protein